MLTAKVRNRTALKSKSLPQRWKRGRQIMAIESLVLLTLLATTLHSYSGADELDGWWLRARFSMREWLNDHRFAPTKDARVALVAIDDYSADKWSKEPLILWGSHMADTIDQLRRSGARLIAFDWTQTVETDEPFHLRNDEKLGQALARAKNVVFVKFIGPRGYVRPTTSLLYSLPDAAFDGGESYLGFADLYNRNGVQSTFLPRLPKRISKIPEVSFASRIAQRSGFILPPEPPLRPDGSLLINFADNSGYKDKYSPFLRVSLYDVAREKTPDPRFKGKIVFIGSTNKGNNDLHYVPFMINGFGSRQIDGVEVQMNAVTTLLDGNAIQEPDEIFVWLMTLVLGAVGVFVYAVWDWSRAAKSVGLLIFIWTFISLVVFIGADFAFPLVLPLNSLVLGCVLMGGYRGLSEERERRQVMRIWGRYQDPRLIQELLDHPDLRSGQGREMEVTVLFADLKNFTRTVEPLSPALALEALNKYLGLFARTIREHGGLVDKYLGDGLMAQWGAPVGQTDHATRAVIACLDIEKRVAALTQALKKDGLVSFEVRLTLHTGRVVAGPLGDDEKLEYTIIGDTVNVTSRLQETSKALGCDFLISETTFAAMTCLVRTGRETEVEIRGRKAPLRVFEILDDNADVPRAAAPTPIAETTTAKTFLT